MRSDASVRQQAASPLLQILTLPIQYMYHDIIWTNAVLFKMGLLGRNLYLIGKYYFFWTRNKFKQIM